jgi:UDP-N-acetylmuramate dehydrogenase
VTTTALRELASRIHGAVRFDEPLAGYTTYRIGGPAAAMVLPATTDDVVQALQFAAETGTPWLALGLGSNVLVSDRGFDGIVIRLGKGLDAVQRGAHGDEMRWTVGAGVPTPLLARHTAEAGLAGVHRLVGVPGTVGGGVFMNAGAHGQDFSQVTRSVELVESDGTVRSLPGAEVPWQYRSSGLVGSVVVGAVVQLTPADPRELQKEIKQHFRWRKAGTPFNERCCGSVFRNPSAPGGAPPSGSEESRTAGQLIDALGLKGHRVGGAQVSSKHANYIVNTGGATADDVLAVIEQVRGKVFAEYGVELQLEVKVIE